MHSLRLHRLAAALAHRGSYHPVLAWRREPSPPNSPPPEVRGNEARGRYNPTASITSARTTMTLNMDTNKRRSFGDIHTPLAREVVLPDSNIQLSECGRIKI